MTEPRVWNIQDPKCPEEAIYIGRGTPFGNPFAIGNDGTRDQVIDKYEELIRMQPDMVEYIQKHLKGVDLKCHCNPEHCHGDVLLDIANKS